MSSSIFPKYNRGAPLFRMLGLLALSAALLLSTAGCGGGSSTTNTGGTTTGTTTTGTGTGGGGGSSTAPNSATVFPVAAGATASGVDINVVLPGASPQANAELLGVSAIGATGTAFNSGAIIHRGTTMEVLLFGIGLNGSMQVTISGANDIAVSNIRAIQSTSGTPGVAFDAAVSGNAALGARTVALKGANNDVTTFTGGLEVMP